MNLFVEYIQPLTGWLQANPHWALFLTFFISLTESLAIIGSIVPGSVTMTAIGIMAGSGIMRVDLTLVAATLGAVVGDSLSYAIGYFYSDRLVDMWPFRKYPNLIIYGKDFFSRHGGKSVLIGRFVGPLRSIIPVIAGIMHMRQGPFLTANIISALGWSLLYVMPGVLIGAASNELSTESATRLFVIILIFLAGLWFVGTLIKWLLIKLHFFLKNNLHHFWFSLKSMPIASYLYRLITPKNELNHYHTAGLTLLAALSIVLFSVLLVLTIQTQWLSTINLPAHLLIKSFHTSLLEAVAIACSQLTSTWTLVGLYFICNFWFLRHKNLYAVAYCSSIIIVSIVASLLLLNTITTPRLPELFATPEGNTFPAINLTVATAFYGFILFYINNKYSLLTTSLRSFILIILGLSGLSALYLGDYWPSDVLAAYCLGAFISLSHYLMYRKNHHIDIKEQSTVMLYSLFIAVFCFTALSTYLNFTAMVRAHTPYHKQYSIDQETWWGQSSPILPLYHLNRIGKKISVLNVQYAGDINTLKTTLEQSNWRTHSETFFTKLLISMDNKTNQLKLPLLTQLFENKKPALVMTYQQPGSGLVLIFTVWESNYSIAEQNIPIWIGTIHPNIHSKKNRALAESALIDAQSTMMPALNQFTTKEVSIPTQMLSSTYFPTKPYILLIKDR